VRFTCIIPGQPVPMGRPRITTRGGFARAYTDKKTRTWLDMASTIIRANHRAEPFDGAVGVRACFVHKRPKRLLRKRDPDTRLYRPHRCDIDNTLKALLDSLQGTKDNPLVFYDDAQVCYVECYDLFAARDESPHVEVEVFPLIEYNGKAAVT